jgi:hypothetical protein
LEQPYTIRVHECDPLEIQYQGGRSLEYFRKTCRESSPTHGPATRPSTLITGGLSNRLTDVIRNTLTFPELARCLVKTDAQQQSNTAATHQDVGLRAAAQPGQPCNKHVFKGLRARFEAPLPG